MWISGLRTVLSRSDSDITITAAFVLSAISLNLSILGSRLLMFKWIRCGLLLLKPCQCSCFNNLVLLKGPEFRLISLKVGVKR